ncbi:MAG TPA: hypothetical protein VLG71_01325 [Candidatus Limnocylindria bacterium]|nr:hypothetical protein [Candidatus Limnocylindria bacterium]
MFSKNLIVFTLISYSALLTAADGTPEIPDVVKAGLESLSIQVARHDKDTHMLNGFNNIAAGGTSLAVAACLYWMFKKDPAKAWKNATEKYRDVRTKRSSRIKQEENASLGKRFITGGLIEVPAALAATKALLAPFITPLVGGAMVVFAYYKVRNAFLDPYRREMDQRMANFDKRADDFEKRVLDKALQDTIAYEKKLKTTADIALNAQTNVTFFAAKTGEEIRALRDDLAANTLDARAASVRLGALSEKLDLHAKKLADSEQKRALDQQTTQEQLHTLASNTTTHLATLHSDVRAHGQLTQDLKAKVVEVEESVEKVTESISALRTLNKDYSNLAATEATKIRYLTAASQAFKEWATSIKGKKYAADFNKIYEAKAAEALRATAKHNQTLAAAAALHHPAPTTAAAAAASAAR